MAVAVACLAGSDARAADEVYTVRKVAVDQTGANAQAARDSAFADGRRRALRLLFERLTQPSDQARLPRVDDREIEGMVDGFEVDGERSSPTRYIANLSFSFKPQPVRTLLRSNGVALNDQPSRTVLVIPVERAGGKALLWDDDNQWWRVWGDRAPRSGLVPYVVPLGDAQDLADLSGDDAVGAKPGRFDTLLRRYKADEVLLAQATPGADGSVTIQATKGNEPAINERIAPQAGEALPQVMERAAQRIMTVLEDRWKNSTTISGDAASGILTARVVIAGADDWIAIRKRLTGAPLISRTTVRSLGRNEAIVDLAVAGSLQQIKSALQQRELILSDDGGEWILKLAPGASRG